MADFTEAYGGLTAHQLVIIRMRCSGLSRKEVAAALFVQLDTIRNHTTDILRAFGLGGRGNTTSGIASICYQLGRYDEREG